MIAGMLLAAGNARRFNGSQKLVASVPHEGTWMPLVRRSTLGILAGGLERVVVVVGRDGELVRESVAGLPVTVVSNAEYAKGMSSSLCVGVSEIVRLWPGADALMIALGDQPLGGTGIVEQLLDAFGKEGACGAAAIVAPRFRRALGNPVIFGRGLVPELLALSGDRGARSIVERDASRVRYVDFDRDAPCDVDTAEDLAVLAQGAHRP